MSDFSLIGAAASITASAPSDSRGIQFNSGNDVKGAWNQLVSSTPFSSSWVEVVIGGQNTGGRWLIDVGIGGAGSEQAVISDLLLYNNSSGHNLTSSYLFPLRIPKGVRVAARAQSTAAVQTEVSLRLMNGMLIAPGGCSRVQACGADAVNTDGTTIDPGTTADVKGSWVQVTAATEFDWRWISLTVMRGSYNTNNVTHAIDVGIGAAGSEVVVVPNLMFEGGTNHDLPTPSTVYLPCWIPKGKRVALRSQCSNANANNRATICILHGVG